jgi:integrase
MRVTNRKPDPARIKRPPYQPPGDDFYVLVRSSELNLLHSNAMPMAAKESRALKKATKLNPAPTIALPKTKLLPPETFEAVADEWFEINKSRWVGTYSSRLRSRLDDDLLAELGDHFIADIEPVDVLTAIRKIEKRGAIESAKRIMNMASSVFRYGVATSRCYGDPTTDLRSALRPPKPPKRRNALPAKDIPRFMRALEAYDGEVSTKLALKILILTFVRTGELRFAKWTEFENLDKGQALWRIPAERMKMRQPHLVPLSRQAVTALKELRALAGDSQFLLPAPTKLGVISENTLLFALYRMGYHTRATVHGFRATASTVLNEAQFNRDWIEMQLAHTDGSIRGVYNAAEWLPGRREMMIWWAEYLDGKRQVSRGRVPR